MQQQEVVTTDEELITTVPPEEVARQQIAQFEANLTAYPKDVQILTELMRLYRQVDDTIRCEAVMRTLRDIPSRGAVREEAKDFVAIVDTFANGERVDIDKLRKQFKLVFEIVESRQEIRHDDIMAAMGCGCSFAIEVLRAFARLGVVSKDLSLGLRKVFNCRNLHWMTICDEDVACKDGLPQQILKHYDEAVAVVRKTGECKISAIMCKTGLGYNSSVALADYIDRNADRMDANV